MLQAHSAAKCIIKTLIIIKEDLLANDQRPQYAERILKLAFTLQHWIIIFKSFIHIIASGICLQITQKSNSNFMLMDNKLSLP